MRIADSTGRPRPGLLLVTAVVALLGSLIAAVVPATATALARDIQAARRGRSSTVAVWVDDPARGLPAR